MDVLGDNLLGLEILVLENKPLQWKIEVINEFLLCFEE